MEEIWKTIIGFEDYIISNWGRVKTTSRKIRYTHALTGLEHFRLSSERFLKVYDNKHTGYKFIQPRHNGIPVNRTIHRLVACTFVNNPDLLPIVNHIDGNKHNNTADNLEWCTDAYNYEHASKTGLTARGERVATAVLNEKCVIAIKNLLKQNLLTHKQIADLFEISRASVSLISEGKTWKHLNSLTQTELTIK